jgi:anti-sigma factor RsiW
MAKLNPDQLGEMLSAYLDGELDAAQRAQVEGVLRDDESARRMLADLRRTSQAVAALPRHSAPASIAADIHAALERSALLGEVPHHRPHAHRARAPWSARLSMAAMIAIVVAGGWWFIRDRTRTSSRQPQPPAISTVDAPRRELASGPAPLAHVSLDEKLATGVDASALRGHMFGAEAVRMQVNVASAAERDEVTRRLTERLAAASVDDLETAKPLAGNAGAQQAFFYRGRSGVNFDRSEQSQILVRATPRQIDKVLAEVGESQRAVQFTNLQVGSLNVQGLERTRAVIAQAQSPTHKNETPPSLPPASRQTTTEAKDLLALLRVIGVDTESVAPIEEGRAGPTGESDRSSARSAGDTARRETESAKSGWTDDALRRDAQAEVGARGMKPDESRAKSALAQTGSLVEQRLEDLKKRALESSAAPPALQDFDETQAQYITLVIEVIPPAVVTPSSAKTKASQSN